MWLRRKVVVNKKVYEYQSKMVFLLGSRSYLKVCEYYQYVIFILWWGIGKVMKVNFESLIFQFSRV